MMGPKFWSALAEKIGVKVGQVGAPMVRMASDLCLLCKGKKTDPVRGGPCPECVVEAAPNRLRVYEADAAGFFKLAKPMGWGLYRVEDIDGGLGSIWSVEKDAETGNQFLVKQTDPLGEVMRMKTASSVKTAAEFVKRVPYDGHERSVYRCGCGKEVLCAEFTNRCEGCGAEYNMSGQRLAPHEQWGEETGESYSDIVNHDYHSDRDIEGTRHDAIKRVAVTPPGKEKMVKELKKNPDVDNPWAVAWSQYNKKKKASASKCSDCGSPNADPIDDLCSACHKKRARSFGEAFTDKKAAGNSKCIKCGKSLPVDDMVKNVHGAGYLCKGDAKDWNKDSEVGGYYKKKANLGGEEGGDGDRPGAEDYAISDCGPLGSRCSVGQVEGHHLGEFDTEEEAIAAIRQDMDKNQFWPNVWRVSDHGNWELMSFSAPTERKAEAVAVGLDMVDKATVDEPEKESGPEALPEPQDGPNPKGDIQQFQRIKRLSTGETGIVLKVNDQKPGDIDVLALWDRPHEGYDVFETDIGDIAALGEEPTPEQLDEAKRALEDHLMKKKKYEDDFKDKVKGGDSGEKDEHAEDKKEIDQELKVDEKEVDNEKFAGSSLNLKIDKLETDGGDVTIKPKLKTKKNEKGESQEK